MASSGRQKKIFLIVGMLISGSLNTLTKKFQMESCAKSLLGHTEVDAAGHDACPKGEEKFSKPWSQNVFMFVGEALVLVTLFGSKGAPVPDAPGKPSPEPARLPAPFSIFAIPAACDVVGTGIGGIGMIFVSAAVWQMMRGSIVVFTSIFSVVFLQRKLHAYHWISVCVTVCGITLVGFASISSSAQNEEGSGALMGVVLIITAQAFNALQFTTEELYCKAYEAPPALIVGGEGVWGMSIMTLLLTAFYFMPGKDNGSFESFPDTVYKIMESPMPLDMWCSIYLVSIGMYNFFGVTMSGRLSAVHRTLVDAVRTATVWAVEIAIFYATESSFCSPAGRSRGVCFGTPWDKWSPLQLLGFVLLVLGTLMYNAIIRLPKCYYPPAGYQQPLPDMSGFNSPVAMLFSPVTRMFSPAARVRLSMMTPESDFEARLLGEKGSEKL
eukprot:gnl/TRDRNA2_/TRDRNA2_55262_c0_seq1.p1 gnl/TRDRNA2_/TRDRNA2_55262_c0~~gnl/TRDRNA2_/TRDRNA2_55262_c0_seq1.p1  ORF type:complete len:440 (-),score=70.89 gnl/TRDRNA2_/TRDRNA2_55262_c0_seq1:69-1388(-)